MKHRLKENSPDYNCLWSYGLLSVAILLGIAIYAFHWNKPLFYMINSWHSILPNKVWEIFNLLAYSRLFILPLLLCALTFVWRRDKIINVVILILAFYVVFYALKSIIGEPRPYIALPLDSFFWLNNYGDTIKSAYKSFPSGHTGNAAIFVFATQHLFFTHSNTGKLLLFIFLLMVALARICSGWHWPLDVLSSMIIGYLLVRICFYKKMASD